MQVRDVRTTNAVTVRENQTRQQAAQLLSQHRISGLPVVNDDNTVTGVVTEYNVITVTPGADNLAKIYHLPAIYFVVNSEYGMGLRIEDELFDYMYAPDTASEGRK